MANKKYFITLTFEEEFVIESNKKPTKKEIMDSLVFNQVKKGLDINIRDVTKEQGFNFK